MAIGLNCSYNMPKEMDRIFKMFSNSIVMRRKYAFPLVNVAEMDDGYVIDACLPGVPPDEVDLTLTARCLIIKGERKSPAGRYFRQERTAGAFQRVVTFTASIDRDRVNAKALNGIVRILLPKAKEPTPHHINIEKVREGEWI